MVRVVACYVELAKTKTIEKKLTQNSLSLKLPYRQQERSVIATSAGSANNSYIMSGFLAGGTIFIINLITP